MREAFQRKLDRVRKPRVQITYDVESSGAVAIRELPFVVGVMGDFSGIHGRAPTFRGFLSIDRDNFDDRLSQMDVGLSLTVENTLSRDGSEIAIALKFRSMDDFEPGRIVEQVEPLRVLLDHRTKLLDLLFGLDGSPALESELEIVLQSTEKLQQLAHEIGLRADIERATTALDRNELTARDEVGRTLTHRSLGPPPSGNLFDRIDSFMAKRVEPGKARDLLENLICEAVKGSVLWETSVARTITSAMSRLDNVLSRQVAAIVHHPDFQQLEGLWRGLQYLVMNTETSATLKIKVLNVSKHELFIDLDRSTEFDQSQIFLKIYETELASPGGEPLGALIGAYEFTNHPDDLGVLQKMSNIAAAAFAPLIAAAAPQLFGFESYAELSRPRDLQKTFLIPRCL
jgi:type VI secretion system protein ImpC